MEMERQKKEEMEGRVAGELLGFAEQGEWERARESFLLSPDEHVRKVSQIHTYICTYICTVGRCTASIF